MTILFHPRRVLNRLRNLQRPDRKRRGNPPGPLLETLEGRALLTVDGAFAATLTHSAEFYTNIINLDYQTFLGRSPIPSELTYYLNELQSGQSDENLLAGFAGSQEFYQTSGNTPAAWINAMYKDILGRTPSASELTYYENSLASGTTRTEISLGFARSPEHETQVITYDYGKFLGRSPSSAELNFYVTEYATGVANEDIIAGFVGSAEFHQDHTPSGSTPALAAYDFVDAAYKTILGRAPTPSESSAGVNFLLPAPVSNLPASAVYNVTVSGSINGKISFSQTGTLVVSPTVTTTGPVINLRDIGIDVGTPGLNGPTGSLAFASNLQLFGLAGNPAAAPPLVLASVAANPTTGTVVAVIGSQAVNTSQVYQNEFNLMTGGSSSFELVSGGTITLQFASGGASVAGTISLKGSAFGSSVVNTYVAKVSGTKV